MSTSARSVKLDERALKVFLRLSYLRSVRQEIVPAADDPLKIIDSKQEIAERRSEIRKLLERSDKGFLTDAAFVLARSVRFAALLGRATAEQYFIISEICDSIRGEHPPTFIAPLTDDQAWTKAVAAARRVRELSTHDYHDLNGFSREHAVANAVRRLEKQGHAIGISTFGPVLKPSSLRALCRKIEVLIGRNGGRWCIEMIFQAFRSENRIYEGYFLYGRIVDQMMWKPREPSVPWHYLYNVALKHLNAPIPDHSADVERDWVTVTELARDMAAVFDVEAYYALAGVIVGQSSFHESLLDKVVYDELFAFQQWQPTVAARLFSSWLRCLANEGCTFPLASVEVWDALGSSLIAAAKQSSLFVTHPADHAALLTNPGISAILVDALAIDVEQLNAGYQTPLDTAKRNSPAFPLFRISPDLYILPPRSIATRSLYERIYTLMRDAGTPDLENRMGKALERLTAEAISLTGHQPAFIGEKYRLPDGKKGQDIHEVDVVEETEKRIFLLECKKKALTNVARSGNTLMTSVDFAQGCLAPLVQANEHEKQLRVDGKISFLDGRELNLDGRDVERVAVAMTDHGSMQDRVFIRAFVLALWGARLDSVDPAHQHQAEKVNNQLKRILEGVTELAGLAGQDMDRYPNRYLLGSWWLSIDQLYFLCSRTESLESALSSIRSITFGTGDLMTEIAYSDRIKRNAKKASTASSSDTA